MGRKKIVIAISLLILVVGATFVIIDPLNLINSGSETESYLYGDFDVKITADGMVDGYARQKTQLNGGIYDLNSNSTFIVYSSGTNGELSACSPYIITFNHTTQLWSAEKEIQQSPVEPDAHNYPSLLIDSEGYLHVFHTFHGNHEILYAKSKYPRDITEWNVSYINGTEKATYGAAYRASNGDLYLITRMRITNSIDYEPEYIIKSVDGGEHWEIQKIIDPAPIENRWGTIYTKGILYDPVAEGLYIVFGVHQYHNQFLNKHYFTFYNFSNNHLYSVDGIDYGMCLEGDEFEGNIRLFDLGSTKSFYNIRMAIGLDNEGHPYVFWAQKNTLGDTYLRWAQWSGNAWQITDAPEIENISPFGSTSQGEGVFTLYAKKWGSWVYQYTFDSVSNTMVNESLILHTNAYKERGFDHIMFIQNAHPEIFGFFIEVGDSDWSSPKPDGKLITFGEKG